MTKAILRWFPCALLSVMAAILVKLLCWAIALFARQDGTLPAWLVWAGTVDNTLDGDNGWKSQHWLWAYRLPPTLCTYVRRVGWLFRNSAYGLDELLGFDGKPKAVLRVWGNQNATDAMPGWYFKILTNPDGSAAWQFFFMWHYWPTRGVRVNLGWKLWGWKPGEESRGNVVISVNPFKGW